MFVLPSSELWLGASCLELQQAASAERGYFYSIPVLGIQMKQTRCRDPLSWEAGVKLPGLSSKYKNNTVDPPHSGRYFG